MNHIVPQTLLYGPTGTMVLNFSPSPPRARGSVVGSMGDLKVLYFRAECEEERTEMCPRLSTVSSGSFTKSSAREMQNVLMEEAVGVVMGSI
jgi:hypothetical protein